MAKSYMFVFLVFCATSLLADWVGRHDTIVEISLGPDESVQNAAARRLLQKVAAAATKAKYKTDGSIKWSDGYFEAVRVESPRIHHRVAIWLDWKFSDPGQTLIVRYDYVQLRKYQGSDWRPKKVGKKSEQHATRELKRQIAKVAGFPG